MNDGNPAHTDTGVAILAGGCFWCLDAVFRDLDGVDSVDSGYTGGTLPNPSYEAICTGRTGHAEAVRVRFRPAVIRYEDLLDVFFAIHDPTTLNRQGADVGTQYRSEIFTTTPDQRSLALDAIERLARTGEYDQPIVTAVSDAGVFYEAEAYHDDYFRKNPNAGFCRVVIGPKVAKFRKQFSTKLNESPRSKDRA